MTSAFDLQPDNRKISVINIIKDRSSLSFVTRNSYFAAACAPSQKIESTRGKASRVQRFPREKMRGNAREHELLLDFRDTFSRLADELQAFDNLSAGWDGYSAPAPNGMAIKNAKKLLMKMRAAKFVPDAVTPSVLGGTGISRRVGKKYVLFELFNNGSGFAVFAEGAASPIVQRIDFGEAALGLLLRKMQGQLDGKATAKKSG